MTPAPPDKTLEELAKECAEQFLNFARVSMSRMTLIVLENHIQAALQSATASQQREVERLNGIIGDYIKTQEINHAAHDVLRAQLRTEQERNRQWRRYAQHGVQCDLRPDEPCSCGLQALRDSGAGICDGCGVEEWPFTPEQAARFATEAASRWDPSTQNHDPSFIAALRYAYSCGYESALLKIPNV